MPRSVGFLISLFSTISSSVSAKPRPMWIEPSICPTKLRIQRPTDIVRRDHPFDLARLIDNAQLGCITKRQVGDRIFDIGPERRGLVENERPVEALTRQIGQGFSR